MGKLREFFDTALILTGSPFALLLNFFKPFDMTTSESGIGEAFYWSYRFGAMVRILFVVGILYAIISH